ncbi:MAG: DUF2726 domain-containing protein [Calditrichia bacterium]
MKIDGICQGARRQNVKTIIETYSQTPAVLSEKGLWQTFFGKALHKGQVLTCRVDFVVCDFEGCPEFAVEYNGGYHEDGQQTDRDEFKRRILNEVGLALRVMGRQDLQVATVD